MEHPFDVTIKGGHLVAFPDLELCALITFELDVHDPLLLAMCIVHAIKGEVLEVILRRGSPEEQEDDCLHCRTAYFTAATDRDSLWYQQQPYGRLLSLHQASVGRWSLQRLRHKHIHARGLHFLVCFEGARVISVR